MARMTAQVQRFYKAAKEAGLKRGDFTATSRKNQDGEYQPLDVTLFVRLRKNQVMILAQYFKVEVYRNRLTDPITWGYPLILDEKPGLFCFEYDPKFTFKGRAANYRELDVIVK